MLIFNDLSLSGTLRTAWTWSTRSTSLWHPKACCSIRL